jgi:hypothetical protein
MTWFSRSYLLGKQSGTHLPLSGYYFGGLLYSIFYLVGYVIALEGFKGKLHVDGYKGYEGLPASPFLGVGLLPGENLMRHKRQLVQHKEGN